MLDRGVERPRVVWGRRRRDLDRDVVDIVTGEQLAGALETTLRLPVAEHRLAEEVHVEPDARLADARDRAAETRIGGVDDEVAHHAAQHGAGDRYDDAGQDWREHPTESHGPTHVPGQERRHLRRERSKVASRDTEILGPHDPVDEADREVEPVRVAEHASELGCRTIDRNLGCLGQPATDERDALVRELGVDVGEGVGSGGARHHRVHSSGSVLPLSMESCSDKVKRSLLTHTHKLR
jgi:hypothetical protein